MFEAFFLAALLTVVDPVGDAVGAGSLEPPSAAVYRNRAPFDIRRVTVDDKEQLTVSIEMGSLSNPFDLPLGFSLPVIEVYLEGSQGGRGPLLDGSGMRLPEGRSWEVALRLTGESAEAYRASSDGSIESAPARVVVDGNLLIVSAPFTRPSRTRVYAMTGLYDLFGANPWRPVEATQSPWAFSGESQRFPVVDVLTEDAAAQRQALESGVLAAGGSRASTRGAGWLMLMALGLLMALAGVALRAIARRPTEPPQPEVEETTEGADDQAGERAADREPDGPGELMTKWDSSALLTSAEDDEFVEEFSPPKSTSDTSEWIRPVPLRIGRFGTTVPADDDAEPEVVTEDSDEAADQR